MAKMPDSMEFICKIAFLPNLFSITESASRKFGGRELKLWQSEPSKWILSSLSSFSARFFVLLLVKKLPLA